MFIAALFTKAKTGQQTKSPQMDEWVKLYPLGWSKSSLQKKQNELFGQPKYIKWNLFSHLKMRKFHKNYTHTHTHTYTYIKEEILSFLTTWMEFEGIKLREVCHRKTNTDLTCAFFKKKKLRKRSDLWFTRGMGVRGVVKRYKLPGITLISSGGTRYNMTTALTAAV